MTFAALVEGDGDSTRTFDEAVAAESRVNVEAVGFAFAKFVDPRRFRAVVERVGHAILFEWIEDT